MEPRSQKDHHHTLSFFCKSSFSLKTKLALLTFYKVRYPIWTEKFILLFEYLQLLSQAILAAPVHESSSHNLYFIEIVTYTLKLVNPSYLLLYRASDSMASTVLIMIFCCTFLKLLLFINAIYTSLRNREMNSWLLYLWRWTFKCQTRILYFLFTSFWVNTMIEAKERGFNALGMSQSHILAMGSVVIALEFILSLILETQLCYFLHDKDFLSSKNNQLQMIAFFQKFIIQILTLLIRSDSRGLIWVACIVGVTLNAAKFGIFFYVLPLYSQKALSWQGSLLSTVISMNIARLIHIILKSKDYTGANLSFVIITWILLALLINKISQEILEYEILSLIATSTPKRVELLLHKVPLTRQLLHDEAAPTLKTSNYAFNHLVSMHQRINIYRIFGVESRYDDENPPEKMSKIYLWYYQELSRKFPKNSLVKLHTAERSFKNSESYTKTIQITNEIQENKKSKYHLSSSLLLYEIEKSILEIQKQKNRKTLDYSTYIKSRVLVERVVDNLLEQTELQIKICSNILDNFCDLEEMYSSAQKIHHLKLSTQRQMDRLSRELAESYISPFLVYAEYHLVANHSISDFRKYYEIYIQRYTKLRRFFKWSSLVEENIYQGSNILLLISTQKNESGKILYCSNSLSNLCGEQRTKTYQGLNISIIFPKYLREGYYDILFQTDEMMDKIHHTFLSHKDGYLVEADFCLQYHPYLAQGLCLSMIIRPAPVGANTDFLLLRENGDIEGASKKLSKILNLRSNSIISIKALSEELYMVNNAFNMVLNIESRKTISYERALEIFTAYTSEEQEIQMYAFQEKSQRELFSFLCQIQVLDYGDSLKMRLVKLIATSQDSPISEKNSPNPFTEKDELMVPETFADYEEVEDYLKSIETQQRVTHRNFTTEEEVGFPTISTERRHFMGSVSPRLAEKTLLLTTQNQEIASIQGEASFYGSSQSTPTVKSAEKAENKIFKMAILSKSYPRSFTSLCLIFYLVILLTFAGQIIMKSVSDSTMKDLQIRKNMLKASEERSYKGGLIQMNGRGVTLVLGKYIETGGTYVSIATTVVNFQIRVGDMKEANDKMLNYVYSLDEETQKELFQRNVLMNGTYYDPEDPTYKYLNLFEVTDNLASAIWVFAGLRDPSTAAGYQIAAYLMINLVNDFLYESARVTNRLSETVEEQKVSLQHITNLFLILNPFLLTGVGILLSSIIWNQHRIEKQNLKAFLKISPAGVQAVADRFAELQKSLINQETFIKKGASTTKKDIQTLRRGERASSYSRKAETRKIRYKAFRKRYFKYIIRVIACISVLVMITLWDLVTTRQAIQVIYNRQSQLQFANYISNRMIVAQITVAEVFYSNDTAKIEHGDTFEVLLKSIETIKEIQEQIPEKFLEVDKSYNPVVQSILFEDNPKCNGFTSSFIHYCQVLAAQGQPTNLLVAIAAYQKRLVEKAQDFRNADRSSFDTLAAASALGPTTLVWAVVVMEEAHRIANIMDESMTQRISEMQDLKITIIIVFSISLCVVSFLIWIFILKVIREVYNDFKKVLQILPPNLVLSSYLIQKFLRETSPNGFFFK